MPDHSPTARMPRPRPQYARQLRPIALLTVLASLVLACAAQAGQGPSVTDTAPAASARADTVLSAPATSPPGPPAVASPPQPTDRPRPTPGPTVPQVPALQPPAFASRVVVAELGIDLPVISGDLQPPPSYPLCDVAAYVTRFSQPYEPGITYISAHAQRGMFLPLLDASLRADGAELLGQRVEVYTSDGRRFDYVIERVVRHAVDYAVVADIPLDERHLILQTSEGPYGTVEKLQVVAVLADEATVDPESATPRAQPRECEPPPPAT